MTGLRNRHYKLALRYRSQLPLLILQNWLINLQQIGKFCNGLCNHNNLKHLVASLKWENITVAIQNGESCKTVFWIYATQKNSTALLSLKVLEEVGYWFITNQTVVSTASNTPHTTVYHISLQKANSGRKFHIIQYIAKCRGISLYCVVCTPEG